MEQGDRRLEAVSAVFAYFTDAAEKIARYEDQSPRAGPRWALTYGAAAVLALIVMVGVLAK
jgi:hypothetical protein